MTQLEGFVLLALLAAMVYWAFAYSRWRSGWEVQVFGWSALGAFAMQAILMAGVAYQSTVTTQLTPAIGIDYETWDLIGAVATFLHGLALLCAGLALICLGWHERSAASSAKRPRGKRKAR